MTGEQLRQFASSDRPTLAKAFHGMLTEFGYGDLTQNEVTKHIISFVDQEPQPDGIIAKFIYGWLENGIDD
jgi:hypothetical protein